MGVNVPLYRAAAFTVSSMYAGLAGVLLALAFGRIVPESFGFLYSIDFLVMIVIGGLGSVGGAVVGAVIVTALPQVLLHYADRLPLVAAPGGSGLQPDDAARFLYGAAVVAVLIFASGGLAGLARRFRGRATHIPRRAPHESIVLRVVAVALVLAAARSAGCGSKGSDEFRRFVVRRRRVDQDGPGRHGQDDHARRPHRPLGRVRAAGRPADQGQPDVSGTSRTARAASAAARSS